jgi:hypothetical protein
MTDWLPWGLLLMGWVASTLGFAIQALGQAPVGTRPDLRRARLAFRIGGAATVLVYLLYLVFQERWIWY